MYYVYAHTKPDNTVFYIGKGTRGRAWSTHGRNTWWQHTVKKHGHKVVLLADGLTQEQAVEEEAAIIAYFKPFGSLVNILDRGNIAPSSHPDVAAAISMSLRGIKRSEETKAKLRLIVRTQEWRQKCSEAAKKRGPVSEETRLKLSVVSKGRLHTEESRKKMSASASKWQTGRKLSEEHRANVSKNNPWKGKKRPEQAALMKAKGLIAGPKNPFYGQGDRQKGSLNHMAVAVVGTHQIYGERRWDTLKSAADELGVSVQAVCQALRKQGRSKGWAFRKAQ
jgi:hypothetical protein